MVACILVSHARAMVLGDKKKIKQLPSVKFEEDEEKMAQIFEEFVANDNPTKEAFDPDDQASRAPRATKKRPKHAFVLDLHGLNLDQAKDAFERFLAKHQATGNFIMHFKIITGKGLHSGPEGGVLVKYMYIYIRQRLQPHIIKIDSSPADDLIEGLPIRGHFSVSVRF